MKRVLLFLFLLPLMPSAQTKSVNVHFMLRGYFYAGTSIEDTSAAGGFWESPNKPKPLNASFKFNQPGIALIIDTSEKTSFGKNFRGYKVYLVNNSDTITTFQASDSRLSIVAEVYINKKWQPIEYLPHSSCGNSYHHVYIKPKEYWEFHAPAYTGATRTKLRFRLESSGMMPIYSNEVSVSVNKKQLSVKQGHAPQGLMDPYVD